MPPPSDPDPSSHHISDARRKFIRRIAELPIKPAARDYYVRWAESWTKARGHQSPERTQAYFDALGRSAHLADWQFRQAVDAARILACDVLTLPWASAFDWRGLSDQAHSLEHDHRTLARETIRVRANLPPSPTLTPKQAANAKTELKRLIDSLRRVIRIRNMAMATEESSGARWTGAQRRARRVAAGAAIKLTSTGTAGSSASATRNPANPLKPPDLHPSKRSSGLRMPFPFPISAACA